MSDDLRGLTSVLVVVAHPDDAEFGVGGTIARFAKAGADVHVCVVTNGGSGMTDPALTRADVVVIRRREQENASAALGAKQVVWLGYEDGYLTPSIELRRDITRHIRAIRPELLIASDPTRWYAFDRYINHPDHRAVGEAALAAVIPSSDTRLVFPELLDEGLEPHKLKAVWLANPVEADHWVDITDSIELKIEALRRHASQVSGDVGKFVKERAQVVGEAAKLRYAEAYKAIWFG